MAKTLTFYEAWQLTGINDSTWRRYARTGKIKTRTIKKGGRDVVVMDEDQLSVVLASQGAKSYGQLYDLWIERQRSGFHTNKPLKAGVDANIYGIKKFWEYLGRPASVDAITPASLRIALANVPLDAMSQNCHYTQRDQMYKAVRSFYKLLIDEGMGSKQTLDEFKDYKPKRTFEAKKTVLQKDQLEALLQFNDEWLYARTEFDRVLMKTLLILLAYSGLRREEAVRLQLEHLDLNNEIIHVIDGKGHKNRRIGMAPELKEQLKTWLGKYRPQTKFPNVLVTAEGRPLTGNAIAHRICRISKLSGIKITAHGLRRTFATVMEAEGMSWGDIKTTLGHSSITTTQSYVMPDEAKAIAWIQNYGTSKEVCTPKAKPKLSATLRQKILALLDEDF